MPPPSFLSAPGCKLQTWINLQLDAGVIGRPDDEGGLGIRQVEQTRQRHNRATDRQRPDRSRAWAWGWSPMSTCRPCRPASVLAVTTEPDTVSLFTSQQAKAKQADPRGAGGAVRTLQKPQGGGASSDLANPAPPPFVFVSPLFWSSILTAGRCFLRSLSWHNRAGS